MLDLVAGPHAQAAQDASAHVDGIAGVRIVGFRLACHRLQDTFANPKILGDLLQSALAALRTGQTIQRVVGEQELHGPAAHVQDLGILGRNVHSVGGRRGAGGGQAAQSLDLDDAQAARAVRLELGIVAERRHVGLGGAAGVEDRPAFLNRDCAPVDRQVRHGYSSSRETIVLP
jgi:hypothetical protein